MEQPGAPAPASGAPPFVQVTGLGRRFGDAWAVRNASFGVARGELFGLIGPNGAGKTTTLKMLAGLLAPSEGTARVGGLDVQDPRHRARVGYLPEDSALYEEMQPRAYLRFFAELYGVPRGTAKQRIEATLDGLALDAKDRRIGDLSKGNKRKVALARSLIHEPELLLYDEPASGLDPVASQYVLDLLQRLRSEGKTVVLSAHNLFHLERVCDRVLILRKGEVAAQGTMPEIRARFGGQGYRVRLSVPVPGSVPAEQGFEALAQDMEDVAALEAKALAQGGRVLEVAPRERSLEEIFLRHVAR